MRLAAAGLTWRELPVEERAARLGELLAHGHRLRMSFAEPAADRVALRYVLTDPAGHWVGLSASVAAGSDVESLVGALPEVHWDEREMQDLAGVRLREHPDPRPLLLPDGYEGPPPLAPQLPPQARAPWRPRLLFHHGIVHVPVGPVHAGIIETGHFMFSAMGETVLQMDLRLGWDHRGLEAGLAGRHLADAARVVERTCGNCSASHQEALAQAVEALLGWSVDQETWRRRRLILELERVYNHVSDLSQLATGVGLAVLAQQGLQLKEKALRLNAAALGHRYLFGTIRPGWARPSRDASGLGRELRRLAADSARWADHLFSNVGFRDRTQGAGVVAQGPAAALGGVGPVARASGVRTDVRAERPVGAYEDVRLGPVTRTDGDVLARAEVRREELAKAFELALGCLAGAAASGTPRGAGEAPPAMDPLASGCGVGMTESPRGATIHYLSAARGRIVRYHMRTASFTNWPLIMVAAQDNPIGDFPLINKSFELCYGCSDR